MAKYLQRSCPKCNGYLGIVLPERKAKMPVRAIKAVVQGQVGELAAIGVTERRFLFLSPSPSIFFARRY
jgi:hypothetical protein